jgi:D-tyrosyl-tRNA(Tyr) deacylase
MRVVLQRVNHASVSVNDTVVGRIGAGYVALVGIGSTDDESVVEAMADKVAGIRLFPNPDNPTGKPIDTAITDAGGAILVVSQFTLYADTSRGRRPGFSEAARPEVAAPLVDAFVDALQARSIHVETGRFGAHMHVSLENDGPVTIILEL